MLFTTDDMKYEKTMDQMKRVVRVIPSSVIVTDPLIEELEEYLKESQEGRKKATYNLCEMHLENLSLTKEYAK